MELSLEGRRAVVTGASAGIGRACAMTLAASGAQVVAAARRAEKLQKLSREAEEQRIGSIVPFIGDVTNPDDRSSLVSTTEEQLGGADILVNCAGGSRTLAMDAEEAAWREAFELNFWSVHRLTHALLPGMMERRWGRIVTITGSSEPKPMPVYSDPNRVSHLNAAMPAKTAVHAWAKGVSREVAPYGVTVNSIPPGRVMSEQVERIYPTEAAREEYAKDRIPVGRFGGTNELASVVLFLCTDHASYITGELIHVDGGMRNFAF